MRTYTVEEAERLLETSSDIVGITDRNFRLHDISLGPHTTDISTSFAGVRTPNLAVPCTRDAVCQSHRLAHFGKENIVLAVTVPALGLGAANMQVTHTAIVGRTGDIVAVLGVDSLQRVPLPPSCPYSTEVWIVRGNQRRFLFVTCSLAQAY